MNCRCKISGMEAAMTDHRKAWYYAGYTENPDTRKECRDHEGNIFSSVLDMCEYWGIRYNSFYNRTHYQGMTLEQALTIPANRYQVTDPKGRVFESARQMCKAWKIDYGCYMGRLDHGWDMEKALTTPSKKYTIELAQDVIRARKKKKEKKQNG